MTQPRRRISIVNEVQVKTSSIFVCCLGHYVQKLGDVLTEGIRYADGGNDTYPVKVIPDVKSMIVQAIVDYTGERAVTTVCLSPKMFAWAVYQAVINPMLMIIRPGSIIMRELTMFPDAELTIWIETRTEDKFAELTGENFPTNGIALYDKHGQRLV